MSFTRGTCLYQKPLAPEVSTPKNFTPKGFRPDTVFTRNPPKVFTPGTFYTRQLLHQKALHQRFFYTKDCLHQSPLKSGALPTKEVLHHTTLQEGFYMFLHQVHQELLHQRAFTPEHFLHQRHFTPKTFTLKSKDLLHQKAFTTECFYTRRRFLQRAVTPYAFYTKEFSTKRPPECKTQHDCADQRNPGLQNTMTLRTNSRPAACKTCFLLLLRKSDTHKTLTRLLRKSSKSPFFFY